MGILRQTYGYFKPRRIGSLLNRDYIIKKKVKRDGDIIYGGRAINAQVPAPFQRVSIDYDVLTKTPKKRANELDRLLDNTAGGNFHYVKPAMHPGTFKVMDKGSDGRKGTSDDFGIADYSKPSRKVKSVKIRGIRYVALSERIKDAKTALADPMFSFRHDKDRRDLMNIKLAKKFRRSF